MFEPTYSTHEMLDRIDGCTTLSELRGYGQLLDEEKKRYSLDDLDKIHDAYKAKTFEFYLYAWIDSI